MTSLPQRESEKFILIIETKDEQPLVGEAYLAASNYEAVYRRYERVRNNPEVIRVAMARLVFERGNEALLQEGK